MNSLFGLLLRGLSSIASVGIVAMMLLICADVAGRAFLGHPIHGVPEIIKTAVVAIAWLQFAHALRMGQHLRSTMLFDMMPHILQRTVFALNCLAGIAIFGLIAYLSSDDVINTFREGTFEGELPVRVPVWPVWGFLCLGAALCALEYLIQLISGLRGTHVAGGWGGDKHVQAEGQPWNQ